MKVVAKDEHGLIIWQATDFDTEEEAEAYRDEAIEKGWDKTNWGEELMVFVEPT